MKKHFIWELLISCFAVQTYRQDTTCFLCASNQAALLMHCKFYRNENVIALFLSLRFIFVNFVWTVHWPNTYLERKKKIWAFGRKKDLSIHWLPHFAIKNRALESFPSLSKSSAQLYRLHVINCIKWVRSTENSQLGVWFANSNSISTNLNFTMNDPRVNINNASGWINYDKHIWCTQICTNHPYWGAKKITTSCIWINCKSETLKFPHC